MVREVEPWGGPEVISDMHWLITVEPVKGQYRGKSAEYKQLFLVVFSLGNK